MKNPHYLKKSLKSTRRRSLNSLVFLGSIVFLLSACGKRGALIPPEPESIPFPRQYPTPLPEEDLHKSRGKNVKE
jgi:hypothetical protein